MNILQKISIQLLCIYLALSTAAADRKVWSICTTKNESTETCRCGNDLHDTIVCDATDTLQFRLCYCLFYEESENRTIAGDCMVTCHSLHEKSYYHSITRYSEQNGSLLNEDMCNLYKKRDSHREGRFCGRCKKGFGLAVYSYHYTSCIPCQHYSYKNWLKYFAISLLPVTVLYFIVVLLKINISSSRISGSLFTLQCLFSPLQLRFINDWASSLGDHSTVTALNVVVGILGIVNLDFLRGLYPSFCLHPKLNILHVVSLDFNVALYPFFLIFLTYVLVSLYDKNFRLLVWTWKPFKWCLKRYRRQFEVKGSLIEAFATFILLSNVKILAVCIDLLLPTRAYNESGLQLEVKFLYYDANIEYFSSEHLPFAVLALFVGFVFVFLPFLLLLLYPCSCFQQLLNAVGWRCQALHIFMDAFQGSYRTKPRDLRYFSALYLLLRFLILFTVAYTTFSVFFLLITAFLVTVGAIIFAVFQPYKQHTHNRFDLVAMFVMVMLAISVAFDILSSYLDRRLIHLCRNLIYVSFSFILIVACAPIVSFFVSSPTLSPTFANIRSIVSRRKMKKLDSSTSLLINTLDRE